MRERDLPSILACFKAIVMSLGIPLPYPDSLNLSVTWLCDQVQNYVSDPIGSSSPTQALEQCSIYG